MMHGVHDDLWEDGAEGEWVICPECGKLFFWELPLFQWKVSHGFILLCSAKCGKLFFAKHPLLCHGTQVFMERMVECKPMTPWVWKESGV